MGGREAEVCLELGEGRPSPFNLNYCERLWGQHKMVLQMKSTFEKPQELFKTGGLIDQCTKRYSQGAREFFCGDEIVLYLDYTGSYMSLRMDKDTQNYTHKGECRLGLPWQASAWDSALPMQRGAWVQPLIGSRMP